MVGIELCCLQYIISIAPAQHTKSASDRTCLIGKKNQVQRRKGLFKAMLNLLNTADGV